MNSLRLSIVVLFWLILGLDCFIILNEASDYRYYTKPLLMPLLYVLVYISTQDTSHHRSRLLISLALLFSFMGDILLLNDTNVSYFTFGLASFLAAHVCYIIFFYRLKSFLKRGIPLIFLSALIILAFTLWLLSLLWPLLTIQNFEVPVTAYAITIGFMLLTAVNTANSRRLQKLAYIYFIPGPLLFVISDSILALNKFYLTGQPIPGIFLMLTYGAGQFLIVKGAIRVIKK